MHLDLSTQKQTTGAAILKALDAQRWYDRSELFCAILIYVFVFQENVNANFTFAV